MDVALMIDNNTCVRCLKCVDVCPSAIFVQEEDGSGIGLRNVSNCIVCGHCTAVCPTDSVKHGDFPKERVHKIEKTMLPTAEQVLELCRARRSNRAFTAQPVPPEKLELILEAAHRAPTASNMQEVAFTLITDSEKLRQVADQTMKVFGGLIKKLKNPLLRPILSRLMPDVYRQLRRMERLQKEHAKGNDPILRGATALILIHTPEKNRFGSEDSNLAYQNGSLVAESLGIAQFYTGYVLTSIKQDKKNAMAHMLGIEGTIHAGMALGVPKFAYPNYIDRKPISLAKF